MSRAELIAKFLQEAPPGEYEQCSACIHAITGDTKSLLAGRAKSLERWNFENYTYVDMGDHGAIVCREARDSNGYFFDPVRRATFSYDFTTRRASEPTGGLVTPPSPLRDVLQRHVDAYIRDSFREQAAGGVYDFEGSIVIILRCSSISLENFRTGSVVSRYVLQEKALKGWTRAVQHFFENGNVMATQRADFPLAVINDSGELEEIAAEVIDRIREFEESWIKSILKGMATIEADGLKKLRKKMSFRGTETNWRGLLTTGSSMCA